MIRKIRKAGLAIGVVLMALAVFAVMIPPPVTNAAIAWALSRVGSSVSIGPTGDITLAPVSGKSVIINGTLTLPTKTANYVLAGPTTGSAAAPAFRALVAADVPTALNNITLATGKTIGATDPDAITVGGVIVPQAIEVTYRCGAAATCASSYFFIANQAYQVVAVNAVWGTAESTASALRIQVEKDTGTTAAGSGTALLTNNSNAGISIKGTPNTVTAGTLTGTGASLQMAAGDRLGIKFETAPTEGASVVVTVTLKRI